MKATTIIAFAIKIILTTLLIRFGLSYFQCNAKFLEQNILFWIFIYIPLFAGYEALLSAIVTTFQKKKP
ncbi:hypothetical protein [Flavobacterium sp. 25HG05S-40]|uniref:hypothetical protein n=1 Tax=Flavobacterium sp. 25HG05S-40 TaxID=3458682 RepID=UPI004043BB03